MYRNVSVPEEFWISAWRETPGIDFHFKDRKMGAQSDMKCVRVRANSVHVSVSGWIRGVDDWMHSRISSLITSLCVSAPHLRLSVVVTLPRQEWPCVEAHTINLRDVLITPLCLLWLPEQMQKYLCCAHRSQTEAPCLAFQCDSPERQNNIANLSAIPGGGLLLKNTAERWCVFLFPLKRVLLFSVFISTADTQPVPPCPVCHPVPRGLLWRVAPTLPSCTTWLTSHSETHFGGQFELQSLQKKERERERGSEHTLTHLLLSDTHTHTPPSLSV